jgi:hypothetical protein
MYEAQLMRVYEADVTHSERSNIEYWSRRAEAAELNVLRLGIAAVLEFVVLAVTFATLWGVMRP